MHHETQSELDITAGKEVHVSADCFTAMILSQPCLQGSGKQLHIRHSAFQTSLMLELNYTYFPCKFTKSATREKAQ